MNTTPIYDFVNNYVAGRPVRMHMPGHKGRGPLGCEDRDLTEIPGADVLYAAKGIIRESEENAARLFGSARTFYSAEGSSLSIRAMLYLALRYAKTRGLAPRILCTRSVHKTAVTGAALLGLELDWLLPPDGGLLSRQTTPERLEAALCTGPVPAAVFVTSPDYPGHLLDIAGLAAVCHAHGCLLLVDNAHGAYLRFLPRDRHPLTLGADLCCDSAHKTLPVLTGGGYLHCGRRLPADLTAAGETALSLFASTSPSYLILQSLDLANAALAGDWPARLAETCAAADALKRRLTAQGWTLDGDEPLKLTLRPASRGYTGEALAAALAAQNVVCEYADPDLTVLMLPVGGGLSRLEAALSGLPVRPPIAEAAPRLPVPERVLPLREALLAPSEVLPLAACEGRVLAVPTVSCPPAIPIAVCGERLTEQVLAVMARYGHRACQCTIDS